MDSRLINQPSNIELSLRFPKFFVARRTSYFELHIATDSNRPLDIEISFACTGFAPIKQVPPDRIDRHSELRVLMVEASAISAGNFVLGVHVRTAGGIERTELSGTVPITINDEPDSSVIDIHDVITAENCRMVAPVGDINIHIPAGELRTINDLINHALDAPPLRIPLVPSRSGNATFSIPEKFVHRAQPGTVLRLDAANETPAKETGNWRIAATPLFTIGRTGTDHLAWLLPRGERTDEKTRSIGSRHVTVSRSPDKDALVLVDEHSRNHTFVNKEQLQPGGRFYVTGGERLRLGSYYEMDVLRSHSAFPRGLKVRNIAQWAAYHDSHAQADDGPTGGARFVPRRRKKWAKWQSAWLFTDLSFGSSSKAALPIPSKGLSAVQGSIHFYRGGFWISNQSAFGSILIDGLKIQQGEIAPLTDDMQLYLGGVRYDVKIERPECAVRP